VQRSHQFVHSEPIADYDRVPRANLHSHKGRLSNVLQPKLSLTPLATSLLLDPRTTSSSSSKESTGLVQRQCRFVRATTAGKPNRAHGKATALRYFGMIVMHHTTCVVVASELTHVWLALLFGLLFGLEQ
jgi:hypothetical protein